MCIRPKAVNVRHKVGYVASLIVNKQIHHEIVFKRITHKFCIFCSQILPNGVCLRNSNYFVNATCSIDILIHATTLCWLSSYCVRYCWN